MKIRNWNLRLGLGLLLALCLLCLLSFVYLPYPPNQMDNLHPFLRIGQTPGHLLGTDQYGRDILSRILYGSRTVLLIGFVSVASGALLGTLLGAAAAIRKGILETLILRSIDGLLAFPGILLALMLVAAIGKGEPAAILAISVFTVAPFARLSYALILEKEKLPMIKAARSFSVSRLRLLTHYYFPMLLPRLLTQFSASIATTIMTEAALSFLGLGVQPPDASWGLMLSEAKDYALLYPYLAAPPAVCISLSVLGFQLLGDGLNDLLLSKEQAG